MITFYEHERAKGLVPVEAMFRAASHPHAPAADDVALRLHWPIAAAISTGIGSQVQRPLATVIVGGMLVGPVMLLLAVRR